MNADYHWEFYFNICKHRKLYGMATLFSKKTFPPQKHLNIIYLGCSSWFLMKEIILYMKETILYMKETIESKISIRVIVTSTSIPVYFTSVIQISVEFETTSYNINLVTLVISNIIHHQLKDDLNMNVQCLINIRQTMTFPFKSLKSRCQVYIILPIHRFQSEPVVLCHSAAKQKVK